MVASLALALLLGSAPADRTVVILPYGQVNRDYLEAIEAAVQTVADVKIRIDPPRELPGAAWYPPRRRWRAEKILSAIDADAPEGSWKVLAVTEREISTTKGEYPDWGIVGLGNIDDRSAVVSSFIYRKWSPTRKVLLRRVALGALHELGHTLGADHCDSKGCLMYDMGGKAVTWADLCTGKFCPLCRARIEAASPGALKPEAP